MHPRALILNRIADVYEAIHERGDVDASSYGELDPIITLTGVDVDALPRTCLARAEVLRMVAMGTANIRHLEP